MKTFKKRLFAVLLSVYMVFGVVSTDYLAVQAFEWVVPSLTVGESLLWLMGLLGMTYTEGASAWRDVSPEYEQDFIDYANEHGMTYNQTSTWLNDVASGKLNQLSEVWTNFKEWVKSKFSSNDYNISSVISSVVGSSVSIDSQYNLPFESAMYRYNVSNGSYYFMFFSDGYNNRYNTSSSSTTLYFERSNTDAYYLSFNYNGSELTSSNVQYTNTSIVFTSDFVGYFYNLDNLVSISDNFHLWDISNSYSDFAIYNPALIPDISFADSNTEDASIPWVIDLPWGNLGDDEEERDKTYDDLVGGLDLGKEIGDLWQALQDLMGVLAVDDAGVLQPNSGGENPPTLEDEVENNKVNGAFVLTGLQKVFPFCIPFDLYAFITLLEAPPVAPVIQYPVYNPVTDSNEIITIDFSTWESVVILFRYIFDFLFIIGLLLMARALIGGGDSA